MAGRKIALAQNPQADLFQSTAPLQNQSLSDQQRFDWLRLSRSKNIGPVTFRELLNHFGSARAAVEALEARESGEKSNYTANVSGAGSIRRSRKFQLACPRDIEQELTKAQKFKARIVAIGETGYPRWLQAIDGAPPLIYVKGELSLAQRPSAAIVGSRNASGAGLKFAGQLAHELGNNGLVITSGLARGIDGAVHHSSIETGTIAVLGGGIDDIYPQQNEPLYHKIASVGLLVSERPIGFYAQPQDFPRRNRLISGISLGTIVVEAALRSGSLTTARFASEQGREVFAVPGHPLDPRASGTNKLIQNGASLTTCANDILEALASQIDVGMIENKESFGPAGAFFEDSMRKPEPISPEYSEPVRSFDSGDLRAAVLSLLGPTPIEKDSLVRLLKCSSRDLQITLLDMDLDGLIEHHGQQMISRLMD